MNGVVLGNSDVWPITFLASVLIWLMFGGLLVLWVIDGRIKREQALHAFFAALISWGVASMIKTIFPTLRPFQVNGGSQLTLSIYHTTSAFPSVHAAIAFALAATVWLHDKKLGVLFVISAIGVGIGRILGNVHYLVDIVGGAVIGSSVAYLVEKLHVYGLVSGSKFKNTK